MAINKDVRSEKIKSFKALFEDQIETISSSGHEWAKFLDCGSRFYKYNFEEQVLIYAQRPNATVCAPLPLWNNVFDRMISKGSKGIALLAEKPDGSDTLHYVFDVADTWHKQNRPIKLWRFDRDTHTEILREVFEDAGDFTEPANAKEIIRHTVDNYIANSDLDYISDAGTRFIARSVDYIVQNRCGLNDGNELTNDSHYFDDVRQLGHAQLIYIASQIAEMSQEILREIEGAVNTFERQKYIAERGNENGNRVQERRGLPATRDGVSGAGTGGQVRPHEIGLPEEVSQRRIHTPAHGNGTESILGGIERDGIRASKSTGGNITGDESSTGEEHPQPSVGQAYEQHQEQGRGNNVSRADLSGGILHSDEIASKEDEFVAEEALEPSSANIINTHAQEGQLSLFPTEEQQLTTIETKKRRGQSTAQKIRQNPVSEEDIKLALLHNPTRRLGRYETYTLLTDTQISDEDITAKLKTSYISEHGYSHPFGDYERNGYFKASKRGILIQNEYGADEKTTGTLLTWPQVRMVIAGLINDGTFISKDEIMIRQGDYQKHNDLPSITDKELQLCSIEGLRYGLNNPLIELYEMLYENERYDLLLDSDKASIRGLIQNPRNNHYLIMDNDERVSIDIDCDDEGVLFHKKDHNLEYKTWSGYFDFLHIQMQKGTLFEEDVQAQRINDTYYDFLNVFDHYIIETLDQNIKEEMARATSPRELVTTLKQIPDANFKITTDDGHKMGCRIRAGEGFSLSGKTKIAFVDFCSWNDLVYARSLINSMAHVLPLTETNIGKQEELLSMSSTEREVSIEPLALQRQQEENAVVEKVSPEDVDLALLKRRPHGSRYEIYKILTDTSISTTDTAKIIRQRYGIAEGGTLSFGDGRDPGWYDCSNKGIVISYGVGSNKTSVQLSWAEVCRKYKELINQGKFIGEDEIAIREGYYNPDSNLASISENDIKNYISYGCHSAQDNIQLYKLARENKEYSELSPMSDSHFKQATHSVIYRSSDGAKINTQSDNQGVLFIKENTNLEFKTWEELYEVFRTTVLQGEYFSNDVIVRVYDQYADIVDFLDSYCAPASPTEETPTEMTKNLIEMFPPQNVGTTILESGEKVVFTPSNNGISLEFELESDKTETRFYTWHDAANAFHFIKSQQVPDQEKTIKIELEQNEREIVSTNGRDNDAHKQPVGHTATPHAPAVNYVITDESHIGQGTPAEKARNNVAAIRILKDLQKTDAKATPEQQQILAQYVGWGGLANVFNENNSTGWQAATRLELKELLTEKEYRAARSSTLTAFYTPSSVIKGIYSGLRQMGFEGGNVLEPAMGTGNFLGLLPEGVSKSNLHGVELDEITGQIAKQLYQKANISVCGFEDTSLPDNFFDVAIGNVPFGNFKVTDRMYDKHNFLIHDYFFAKALDKVRPGGVVAFVTSKGTLDKANPVVRKYLAQRAELLGAVRLPNNTMLANAGTEVTSDILFLQKRERQIDIVPDWTDIGIDNNGIPMNQYFINNPQMILGKMVKEKSMYGNDNETACLPLPDINVEEALADRIERYIHGNINFHEEVEMESNSKPEETLPANPNVKNYSYTLVDKDIYYRENSMMLKVTGVSFDNMLRLKHLVELRDIAKEIIELQLAGGSNEQIDAAQSKLNNSYDLFAVQFGRINEKANTKTFEKDSGYYLLCSLEEFDQNRNFVRKAPFFSQRTIRGRDVPDRASTATDALAISIAEKAEVNMEYMCRLTGFDEQTLIDDLKGSIFVNPAKSTEHKAIFETASEYLSGNVRMKLKQANLAERAFPTQYKSNIEALEKVIPKFLHANEIDVRLGSTWVDDKYIKDFIYETIRPKSWVHIKVEYVPYDSSWVITGKSADKDSNVRANSTYGTSCASAYEIIEDSLNLRDTRIFDIINDPGTGKEKRVINTVETAKAQLKQEEIKQLFKDWLFKDPKRREHLVNKYNELYNCIRPREYDGSGLKFYGMNPEIGLQKHQSDAVARVLYGPNTLLAHEVGAGKTFVMAAGIMESKRIGLCKKSLWVVPNHLTEQTAAEFLSLYPGANILVATKKDFEMRNRKKFCARIATGEYDSVIMGFSQFEKIPVSVARQRRMLNEQIDEIVEMTESLNENAGMRTTVKRMEKTRKSLEAKLNKLNDQNKKDDVVTFEELGVDHLVVDEAHNYKNLYFTTKMRNVAGLSQTEAKKSSDMYMKCRFMDEITDSKGVVFATGTPISNSMTEMYTMMSYLQGRELRNLHLHHFDAWASNFGETIAAIELAPEGTGYRSKTRFAKFFNLPELMTMFKTSADIKTADMLQLPRPEANYHTISVEPTDFQKKLMQSLSDRATAVHNKMVDPHIDNMLKITSDGRKIGLDQRLYDPLLPDQPGTKVNVCADNVFDIWEKNKDTRSTQLVFCDFSTPSKDKFNLYDDLQEKLRKKGIPAYEIAFIHDANSEGKKADVFAQVRAGQIRILLGSTAKMGAGTNVQDKLIALHDLDCPWRPSDLEQRAGRIVRQGNTNKSVDIFRYVTKDTFDAYLYQTIEKKQTFISQIMTSKNPVRSCEDVDESVLKYTEIKALCAGNPKIKEKMDLEVKVAKLQIAKSNYMGNRYALEYKILNALPKQIRLCEEEIEALGNDWVHYQKHSPRQTKIDGEKQDNTFAGITFEDRISTTKEAAGNGILAVREKCTSTSDNVYVGEYLGFSMHMDYSAINKEFYLTLKNKDKNGQSHSIAIGTDAHGNINRIDNMLNKIESKLESTRLFLEEYKNELKQCESDLSIPFSADDELKEGLQRLSVLNIELNLDHDPEENIVFSETDTMGEDKASGVNDAIKEKSSQKNVKRDFSR